MWLHLVRRACHRQAPSEPEVKPDGQSAHQAGAGTMPNVNAMEAWALEKGLSQTATSEDRCESCTFGNPETHLKVTHGSQV